MSHQQLAALDVVVGYTRGARVLDGASLTIPEGRRLALLGANGSGKTTLLRCLSGALAPTKGRVTVDGATLAHTRKGLQAHRQEVQLVLQDPDDQLFSASVAQDVSFGPLNLGLPEPEVRQRVAEALDLLAVTHLAGRPTHQLSYGERKRVAIAGAVAMRPCVLLLDEPTAGLDPSAVTEALAALTRLQDSGSTVVMSTHDVDLALGWADEVAVVVGGRVVQGRPDVVLGDDDLLARARLDRPWTLTLGARLQALGLLPAGPLPRDTAALLAALPTGAGEAQPTLVGPAGGAGLPQPGLAAGSARRGGAA